VPRIGFPFQGWSIRTRLVTVFAVGSTMLLLLTGSLLYRGLNAQLDNAIDQALGARADDIALDLREGNLSIRNGEPYVVLLRPDGQVIDATAVGTRRNPVLQARDLARARDHEIVFERRKVTGLGDRGRLLARPERALDGSTVIVVVGESLDTVIRATPRLGLLLAGTSALLIGLIAGSGWMLAGAALRPVRRMIEEAAAISLVQDGERLRQPPGDDEIALLGKTLNVMLERIEASLAHERAFVDDASHELRTPLSILRGELELAAARPDDVTGMRQALTIALQEAEQLGRLTEDLLVLARTDRGLLARRLDRIDLIESVRRAADRHGAGTQVEVEVVGDEVVVSADSLLAERVVGNLIDNACRHAATRVQVEVATDGDCGRVTVSDDGIGFPSEFLPVAFDRFSRADPARGGKGGGSGLGLAIVAALVRAQGGRVAVGNGGPGGGGQVQVWFPGAEPVEPSDASVPAAVSGSPPGEG